MKFDINIHNCNLWLRDVTADIAPRHAAGHRSVLNDKQKKVRDRKRKQRKQSRKANRK